MARIRSIHPGLWTDEAFVSVSQAARLLFLGILNEADDQGAFAWKPLQLKMRLAAADTVDVVELLAELAEANIIKKYTMDGSGYGAVRNFREWQRPKKPNAIHPLPQDMRAYSGPKSSEKPQNPEPVGELDENKDDDLPIYTEEVGKRWGTGGEKSPQMEDGGCSKEEVVSIPTTSGENAFDEKAALWRDGLATLKAITGQKDGPARKQIGVILDAAGKDHALVLDLLRQAEAKAVDNPLPWIKAAIKARSSPQLPIADDYLGLDAWLSTQETVMTKMQDGRMMPTINGFAPHILADVIVDAISDGGGQISPTPNWDALADWCNEDMFYRDGWKTAIARVAGRLDGAVMSMAVFNMALNGLRRQA